MLTQDKIALAVIIICVAVIILAAIWTPHCCSKKSSYSNNKALNPSKNLRVGASFGNGGCKPGIPDCDDRILSSRSLKAPPPPSEDPLPQYLEYLTVSDSVNSSENPLYMGNVTPNRSRLTPS